MQRRVRRSFAAATFGGALVVVWLAACGPQEPAPPKPKASPKVEKKDTAKAAIPSDKVVNIAPFAKAKASSEFASGQYGAEKATDNGPAEWATAGPKDNIGAWLQLTWDVPVKVGQVELEDRRSGADWLTKGFLAFSDGPTTVPFGPLPDDGSPVKVDFDPRKVTWIRLVVDETGPNTQCIGLREFRVMGQRAD